jgi:hypothetical protein
MKKNGDLQHTKYFSTSVTACRADEKAKYDLLKLRLDANFQLPQPQRPLWREG